MSDLKYGPVGDPNATDMWERAQARMLDGWHVEGQVLSRRLGWQAMATPRDRTKRPVYAYGSTPAEALEELPTTVELTVRG